MSILFLKLLVLPAAHMLLNFTLYRFRKGIKAGDVVGIKFGDELVVNRTVVRRADNELMVKNLTHSNLIFVDLGRAYMQTPRESVDALVEVD